MVTFNETISYDEAMTRGRAQDKAILNLIDDGELSENMPLNEKLILVKRTTEDILNDNAILGKLK